jgi:hypothetical protein
MLQRISFLGLCLALDHGCSAQKLYRNHGIANNAMLHTLLPIVFRLEPEFDRRKTGRASHRQACPRRVAPSVPMASLATTMEFFAPYKRLEY